MSYDRLIVPTIHLGLRPEDIGHYAIVVGSAGRTFDVSQHLDEPRLITSGRKMDCYSGFRHGRKILVATHGMGDPSAAIAFHELIGLAKRKGDPLTLLRVGTAGSLQDHIRTGDTVIVQAAVRDEHTMKSYVPPEVPAFATLEVLDAQREATRRLNMRCPVVMSHCKDDLNRELRLGNVPLALENERYMAMLEAAKTGASSMEEVALFLLAWLNDCWAGSFLKIIGDKYNPFDPNRTYPMDDAINLALKTIDVLAEAA